MRERKEQPTIILGSASPRRREILARIFPDFQVRVSDAEEVFDPALPPEQVCMSLAEQKAAVLRGQIGADDLLICADTVVALDGQILGKPADQADARRMLGLLSGRTHQVYTGLCLVRGARQCRDVVGAQVRFAPLRAAMIDWYVRTGEPIDKAGGYGIQGQGAALIEGMTGDYQAVVGLPLQRLVCLLQEHFDIDPFA